MKQPTELSMWNSLNNLTKEIIQSNVDDYINNSSGCKLKACGIELDYSHQKVTAQVIESLINLAHECYLTDKIDALITGEIVNITEKRPALHTALRVMDRQNLFVDDKDVIAEVSMVREQMRTISDKIRQGKWHGYSGKPITHIINIGIGGSDLGPRFCINALSGFVADHLTYLFISDADPRAFHLATKSLDPETTLFIIASKSFKTPETLFNASKALAWIGDHPEKNRHFIAVTADKEKAIEFGITRILSIWPWVGGRYSLCSAINLITCIAIGYDAYMQLLIGANKMDSHFKEKPFLENLPVMLALLGIWNINFLHNPNLLILTYGAQLELFVPYLQQLDMESNGKNIDIYGNKINYSTGPIVWGGQGNQAQHSYYQLLSQSNHKICADFISIKEFDNEPINSFCDEKIKVLSRGFVSDNSFDHIAGGMSINHLKLDACTPSQIGSLTALYEHKIYVQSTIWGINPFDQPGVEAAKIVNKIKNKEIF